MKIKQIDWYQLALPLKSPFKTSYGEIKEKAFDLVVLTDELGTQGYGELVTLATPEYTYESLVSSRLVAQQFLVPLLKKTSLDHPSDVAELFKSIKGNEMAKSSLETAVWDLYARRTNQNLGESFMIEPVHDDVAVGVSIGIIEDMAQLVHTVEGFVTEGYTRVKLKIKPGYDIKMVKTVREHFPDLKLMVDANSAYSLVDCELLKQLDQYQLEMVEQPFADNDFLDHAYLQQQLTTSICLDENIKSLKDVELAHHLHSCRAINLKIPRVGGLTEALKILDYCRKHHLLVWLGGMYESGVGRALNLQFAAQTSLIFPGDLSATDRYFYEDIIEQPFEIDDGKLLRPTAPGIGIELNHDVITRHLIHHQRL
ncbi:o-succinylbenzoate synthase [Vagococcus xieshaowenii]|uniref:o-succinylbenzoate synthase n=1 Tax=Vagococcus xieshaowenii TaxID=2562451 RepID=A0AAJ5EF35_9ENTE|nr:o-succinylbenzoate synthase [Vagococcus xieshaowenii]QCA28206.1 o-succinylbenzoate synthase [Vagococcus xieshaowenii]TFZ42558.1 o-succinylbenzoate synthase [Vagococcus xieshaowenii]